MFKKNLFFILSFFILIFFSCTQNAEDNSIYINKINFQENNTSIKCGEQKALQISVNPKNAGYNKDNFKYSLIPEDFCKIISSDESGCIIEGVKKGSGVLKVSYDNITDYVQIEVTGIEITESPYISLPYVDLSMEIGQKKIITANIVGGMREDSNKFKWESTKPDIVKVDYEGNTAVLNAKKSGVSVIKVYNSKATYPCEMIVVVPEKENDVFYLTTKNNVISLNENEIFNFEIEGVGLNESDYSQIVYRIVEGNEFFNISGSGKNCSINAISKGQGIIEIFHKKASVPLKINVIVNDKDFENGIDSDTDFVVLDNFETKKITCKLNGKNIGNWSYTLSENGIIDVNIVDGVFLVTALKQGNCILYIQNDLCDKLLKVQIICENLYKYDFTTITTKQNVLRLEKGMENIPLSIELTNSVESDINSLEWSVSDSSIINVFTSDGKVTYSRAVLRNSNTKGIKGTCYVTALREGNTVIKVRHPKSENECEINVYVYKEGTFSNVPLEIKGDNFIAVQSGRESYYDFTILNGSKNIPFDFSVGDQSIINVNEEDGKIKINALKTGQTYFAILNKDMKYPYRVSVLSCPENELNNLSLINCNYGSIEGLEGKIYYVEIKSNADKEINLNVNSSQKEICSVSKVGNVLCIECNKEGNALISISADGFNNTLIIPVYIRKNDLLKNNPYEIECNGILQGYINSSSEIPVILTNASEKEYLNLNFSYDENIINITNENNKFYFKGLKEGRTNIKIKHPLSSNEKNVSVIIYKTETEMNDSSFIWTENEEIKGIKGNNTTIKINCSDKKNMVSSLNYSVDNIDICEIKSENDYLNLNFKKEGTTFVKVECNKCIPLIIKVVVFPKEVRKENVFEIPAVIKGKINSFITINAVLQGDYSIYKNNLGWEIEKAYDVVSNNNSVRFKMSEYGCFNVVCKINETGEKRKSLVIIEEDEKNKNFIYLDKYIYTLKKGESLNLTAKCFNKDIDDKIRTSIKWEIIGNSITSLNYNGEICNIKALEEGVEKVKCYGPDNTFEIEINILENENYINLYFDSPRIIRQKRGTWGGFNFTLTDLLSQSGKSYDYSNIECDCNSSDIQLEVINDYVRFYGNKNGIYYITLKKPNFKEQKIAIIIYENINDINNNFFFTENSEIILNTGSERIIEIFGEDIDFSDLNIFQSGDNCITYEKIEDRKIKINGIKNGYSTLTLMYRGNVNKIKVNVFGLSDKDNLSIKTQSVIYMKKNQSYETYVLCNNTVSFLSTDGKIRINQSGNKAVLYSEEKGFHEIKVWLSEYNYRIINVFILEDNEEAENYPLFNFDKRIYLLKKGSEINLIPYLLHISFNELSFENINDKCIKVSRNNNLFTVKALEEGYSSLEFKANGKSIFIDVYVIEDENYYNINNEYEFVSDYYITSENNYYFEEPGKTLNLSVTGISFDGTSFLNNDEYIWTTSDNSVVSLSPFGKFCSVNLLKKGKCNIFVSNRNCSNVFVFSIEAGSLAEKNESSLKYIYVPKKFISFDIQEKIYTFEAEIKNMKDFNVSDLIIKDGSKDIAEVNYIINDRKVIFTINAVKCGNFKINMSLINGDMDTDIEVIIYSRNKGIVPYITTMQNCMMIKTGQTQKLEVKLINYEEYNAFNYKWNVIKGSKYISLIGSGEEVQVYGNEKGFSTIRVTHIPTGSTLDINVEVSDFLKDIVYITSDTNIVETNISNSVDFLNFTLIGGKEDDNRNFTVSCDDDSVLFCGMNENTLFYRGIKKGECTVNVKNEKSGSLNDFKIRFVIREGDINAGIKCDVNSIYMKKNESSKTVICSGFGNNIIDYSKLEWFIYSQNGSKGNVVSIISSGNQCVIKPVGEGFANIKVTYPPLGYTDSIGIYVGIDSEFSFSKNNIEIFENENEFIELKVPSFINDISKYISYTSLDNSVCIAFGTGKVCCVEGLSRGNAIIRAVNNFDGSVCEMGVTVKEKVQSEYSIILKKNTFLLNPRSTEQRMYASISGKDITDLDNTELMWNILSDTSGCISIYPEQGSDVLLKLNPCNDKTDAYYGRVKPGEAIIEVSHNKCGNNKKTVYVSISEMDNYFSLNNYSENLNVSESKDISCIIYDGKQSDYDNVIWSVTGFNTDAYGNKVEVAKLLTKTGKTCSLLGLNEGRCTLTAFYFGNMVQCEVNVISDRYFRINGASNVRMFPDVTEDNYIDISYILRPSQNKPMWSVQNISANTSESLISIEEITGEQKIRIRPNGLEGKCRLVGFAVGIGQVSVNVDIKFEPELRLLEEDERCIIKMEDGSNNDKYFKYYSYPAHYYIGISKAGQFKDFVNINIEDTVRKGDYVEGLIHIKAEREIPDGGCIIVLDQFKDSLLMQKVNNINSSLKINVTSYYSDNGFYVGFKRGRGGFSMLNKEMDSNNTFTDGGEEYYKIYDSVNDYVPEIITMGDAEQHYFLLKSIHDNSMMKNIDVSIETDDREIEFQKLFSNNSQTMSEIKDRVSGYMKENIPKKPVIEKNSSGSYVFDISTGNNDNKYGVNWNIKENKTNGTSPAESFGNYSERVDLNVPIISYGSYSAPLNKLNFFTKEEPGYYKVWGFTFPQNPDLYFVYKYITYDNNQEFGNINYYSGILSENIGKGISLYNITSSGNAPNIEYTINGNPFQKLQDTVRVYNYNYYEISDALKDVYFDYAEDEMYINGLHGWVECHLHGPAHSITYPGLPFDKDCFGNCDYTYGVFSIPKIGYMYIAKFRFPNGTEKYKFFKPKDNGNSAFGNGQRYWNTKVSRVFFNNDNSNLTRALAIHCVDGYYLDPWEFEPAFYADKTTDDWDKEEVALKYYPDNKTCTVKTSKEELLKYLDFFKEGNKNIYILSSNKFPHTASRVWGNLWCASLRSRMSLTNINVSYNNARIRLNCNDNGFENYFKNFLDNIYDNNGVNNINFINNCKNNIYYYSNDEDFDFKLKKLRIIISWTDVKNQRQKISIPMEVLFYNNYQDYYIYDENRNKIIGKNKNKVNTYINKVISYP